MPIEYYLAAAVALIVIVLLAFAVTGKQSKRVVVRKNPGADELTRQVARAADALEALLVHLKASQPQAAAQVQQVPVRQVVSPRIEPAAVKISEAAPVQTAAAPSIPEPLSSEPVANEPVPAETAAPEEAAHIEPKPRRVKLSMFGR